MILDAKQRLIFVEYCRQQTESGRLMAEQFEKLSSHIGRTCADEMKKRELQKATAYAIVAMDLESVEEFSVKADDVH